MHVNSLLWDVGELGTSFMNWPQLLEFSGCAFIYKRTLIILAFFMFMLLKGLSQEMDWLLHYPPANGKQGPILEEMSQPPLANKNQGNLD